MAKEPEVVWIKCRGHQNCEGNQSEIVFKKRRPGGGWWVRYKCKTCGRTFHVQV